jgi:hypothetical protein
MLWNYSTINNSKQLQILNTYATLASFLPFQPVSLLVKSSGYNIADQTSV